MAITQIDFVVDGHLVRAEGDSIFIYVDGDLTCGPIRLKAADVSRILEVAEEQIEVPVTGDEAIEYEAFPLIA